MAKDLFSIPIFFIVFRETLEAAIIVSVLLGMVDQLVIKFGLAQNTTGGTTTGEASGDDTIEPPPPDWQRKLIRRLRIQIFLGAFAGFSLALAIGAAFIAVWFTKAADLWGQAEDLWEGIFSLIACIIIFIMGITMLKMDRAKAKWRAKLIRAFEGKATDRASRSSRWVLFILPFLTVLREGIEAVVFVGGVSLGEPGTAIPIATIVAIICGFICGFLIYEFASRTTLTVFLIVITNFLLLIGAGLFSKAVGWFESHAFVNLVGADVSEAGDGPGSYDVRGNVWHLDCCSPKVQADGAGWSIFNSIFGWTNNATQGTVLSYVLYWLAVIVVLIYLKFKEGRTTLLGRESEAGTRRRVACEKAPAGENDKESSHDEKDPQDDKVAEEGSTEHVPVAAPEPAVV